MTEPSVRAAYGDHPDQFVEVWEAAGGPPRGTAVLIHGGYWRQRYTAALMAESLAPHLAARGWQVLNIEYRRMAESQAGVWPEMAADVTRAIAFATAEPVIPIGHSAGGQLALWVAAQPDVRVDAVVALAPVADLRSADELGLSDNATRHLLGGSADEIPDTYRQASPIELVPLGVPQLVVHGTADEHVPFDLSTRYVEVARRAGDEVRLHSPDDVDHFHVIDAAHPVWRSIDAQLDEWARR